MTEIVVVLFYFFFLLKKFFSHCQRKLLTQYFQETYKSLSTLGCCLKKKELSFSSVCPDRRYAKFSANWTRKEEERFPSGNSSRECDKSSGGDRKNSAVIRIIKEASKSLFIIIIFCVHTWHCFWWAHAIYKEKW